MDKAIACWVFFVNKKMFFPGSWGAKMKKLSNSVFHDHNDQMFLLYLP